MLFSSYSPFQELNNEKSRSLIISSILLPLPLFQNIPVFSSLIVQHTIPAICVVHTTYAISHFSKAAFSQLVPQYTCTLHLTWIWRNYFCYSTVLGGPVSQPLSMRCSCRQELRMIEICCMRHFQATTNLNLESKNRRFLPPVTFTDTFWEEARGQYLHVIHIPKAVN